MKIKFSLLTILFLSVGLWASAQGGGPRRTVEERVKAVVKTFETSFKLEKDKLEKTEAIFTKFYTSQDKVREEMMSGGERPNFEAMREKMQPLNDTRDKELKEILTEDQFKKWKDELEPALGPGAGRGNRPSRQ